MAHTILRLLFIFYSSCFIVNVYGQSRIISFHQCQRDSDCYDNSYCHEDFNSKKQCRCKENFVLNVPEKNLFECIPVVGINEPCKEDVQCQIKIGSLGYCHGNDKVCRCIDNSHLGNDSMCHETVALGKTCLNDMNCLLSDGSYGFCYGGKCICNTNQHMSNDEKYCVSSSNLAKECSSDENCIQEFSRCYGGICKCIPGYVESENNDECLKAASAVGDNCTYSIQCNEYILGSFCFNNTCACKSAHHGYGNKCILDAKLGEICRSNEECVITADLEGAVFCKNQICTCTTGVSDKHSYGCFIPSSNALHVPSIFSVIVLFVSFVFR
ncbi:hypothetical protein FQA39_LY13170 [Lamprigera yunnana]|nr:hypothetical protein FQA39_LY13170 [Lamprigera yunnana]